MFRHTMQLCSTCQRNICNLCLLEDLIFTCKMLNVLYDHKSIEKFLKGKTENNKFNNWSIEFLSCKLYI